ncbi:hypothetical protein MWG07_10030 [Fusobacterium necrophorum]|uniref:Uncharacterized protein n=1 Tax=Fusobacterium necrophorum TaxID=859 RepID=A0AAW6WDM3_9FUSO|nr:hypothetical protein [Fusobacterium necrophorum]MDK4481529.1 hypothetical protein [Fusobacterium necrophorum]MDK4512588.1 hypothetical protein [Fusobacterium necrophorum]
MRELSRNEIQATERQIQALRGQEAYKYYFADDLQYKEPLRAWKDGGYYIDLTVYDGFYYLGVIKLEEEANGFGFIALIRELLKEYKMLVQWCFLENEKATRFHDILERKMGGIRIVKNNVSTIILREVIDV